MKIWDLKQAKSDADGGYYPENIDKEQYTIRYAGFKNEELRELKQGKTVSSTTRANLRPNDTSDDLGHVIPVMLQGSAKKEENFFRQNSSMNKSFGNSEEKKIRAEIQALVDKKVEKISSSLEARARENKDTELGLIWIFNKLRKDDDNHSLIRPDSILHLTQFTSKGENQKNREKKTVGYHFFNPTDLEYDCTEKMIAMIRNSNDSKLTTSVFKYSIKNLTRPIQKHIDAMVQAMKPRKRGSGDEASKMASEVLRSLKDEEHEWNAEIIGDIYTKVGLNLKKDGIIKEIIATGYALGHYLAFLYAKIFRTELLGQLDREMRKMMQKIYTDFKSGTINQEEVQRIREAMEAPIGGGGERGEDAAATIDNTTETLGFLVDQLDESDSDPDPNADSDSDPDSD